LYETDTATYIAEIENNSVKPIHKIAENLRFYNWSHSYRCRNQNGNDELLKFETKDEKSTGLVDIVDNNIYIHYIINKAELYPKSVGMTNANKLFIERLNFILPDFNNLKLSRVKQEEKNWKSHDNTPNHFVGVGDCWNPRKYPLDTFMSFLTQEDSLTTYTTEYFGTEKYDLVRTVLFEWNISSETTFRGKLDFIENCVTQIAGKPFKEKNNSGKSWKTKNGLTIDLTVFESINQIRLAIFQH